MRGHRYVPFDGMSLTDTFDQDSEYRKNESHRATQHKFGTSLKEAHERIQSQKWAHLHIIIGNPPYSVGQGNANEDNKNISHPILEGRLRETYVKRAPKGNKVSLYNSYIKALRWASDRIGKSGVIGVVTPSSFITGNAEAGVRTCLYEEFTDVWCFNLRGDAKLSGEARRQTGGGIFGSGSREPIGITILVKNPIKQGCTIHYKEVDDYLTREEKLDVVNNVGSIIGIEDWEDMEPDKHHDWINQRGQSGDDFEKHMCMGSKEVKRGKSAEAMFGMYSNGLKTHRDAWVYNSSIEELDNNMKRTIMYCNTQDPNNFVINTKEVAWSPGLTKALKKLSKPFEYDKSKIRTALFRPFTKRHLYFDPILVEAKYRIPSFFPFADSKNLAIMIPDKIKGKFSTFMTDMTPDLHIHEASQCFSLRTKTDKGKTINDAASARSPVPIPSPDSHIYRTRQ